MDNSELLNLSAEEIHNQANKYIAESNQLLFKTLPTIIAQIIEHNVWNKRNNPYKNFGEYALNQSSDGLGIMNNEMLWLLKSAMNVKVEHASEWGDVLGEVESSVRTYAKEKKIPIKELGGYLAEQENNNLELDLENTITYLPSRSRSEDGQLLKLKNKDPQAYENVVKGKMKLQEALPKTPRKPVQPPIESVKNKFNSLSKSDREAFMAWLEQEKENLL